MEKLAAGAMVVVIVAILAVVSAINMTVWNECRRDNNHSRLYCLALISK
jgi:hypothetical protein